MSTVTAYSFPTGFQGGEVWAIEHGKKGAKGWGLFLGGPKGERFQLGVFKSPEDALMGLKTGVAGNPQGDLLISPLRASMKAAAHRKMCSLENWLCHEG